MYRTQAAVHTASLAPTSSLSPALISPHNLGAAPTQLARASPIPSARRCQRQIRSAPQAGRGPRPRRVRSGWRAGGQAAITGRPLLTWPEPR